MTDIILCEVLQRVRDDVVANKVERSLLKLEVFETGGVTLAREAAAIAGGVIAATLMRLRSSVRAYA